jgi:Ca2+-binding RTX toxin-like protein
VWIASARAGTIVSNVADGILTVNGTTEGDDVTVRCEGGQVTVNHDHPSGGPTACADLRRFLVFAGEGPDRVSLDDVTLSAFDHLSATSVSGQAGDDALIGSEIGDDLVGGGGDLLQAGTGDDRILGGDGNDFVQAGDGDDELEGGMGDDSLSGESGNDELSGGRGDDTCRGGPGADSFVSC